MRPSSSAMISFHCGCSASSALRLGICASISGARSMTAPDSSSAISCVRERLALNSTSVCTSPLSIRFRRSLYSDSSAIPAGETAIPVSSCIRLKNAFFSQFRSTISDSKPVTLSACAAAASRQRASIRAIAAVFFMVFLQIRSFLNDVLLYHTRAQIERVILFQSGKTILSSPRMP